MCRLVGAFYRWLFRLNPKCYICRYRGVEMDSIPRHGIYGGLHEGSDPHFFHIGCVHAALDDPEFFGHATVDRALSITDRIADRELENEKLNASRRLRIERAQAIRAII